MPVLAAGLTEAVTDAVAEDIQVLLHTEDPGAAGTAGRITTLSIPAPVIDGGAWTVTGASAVPDADVSFGTASVAITGASWYSLWKRPVGQTSGDFDRYWAKRELLAPTNIANGAPVSLTASTLQITASSTD